MRLALLLKASANRVYGASALQLGRAELLVLDRHVLGTAVEAVAIESLGGVDYLVADLGDTVLDTRRLALLSNLSSLHALFAMEGEVLRPLPLSPIRCVDEDIVTIQRYAGKTNDAFTHLLVNLAVAVGGTFERLLDGERVRLLDPACGRGTTLNRAVVYGADALGVELDGRDVEAYGTFLLTWLQDKRLKHTVDRATLRKGRPTPAHRLTVRYGRGKDRDAHRVVDVVHDDTGRIRDHVPARSVDAIACDLPYGVQHGSRPATGALDRRPDQLLADALPGWRDVLRPGGGMALGWNTRTMRRHALLEQLVEAGLEVLEVPEDATFAHRVDRAIARDVVLARRPR